MSDKCSLCSYNRPITATRVNMNVCLMALNGANNKMFNCSPTINSITLSDLNLLDRTDITIYLDSSLIGRDKWGDDDDELIKLTVALVDGLDSSVTNPGQHFWIRQAVRSRGKITTWSSRRPEKNVN